MRLLLFFSVFLALYTISAQEQNFSTLDLDPLLTKNANAVVRFDNIKINLPSKKQMIVKRSKAITVLNEQGDRFATVYVGYDKGRKVKDINAIIYDKNGNEIDKIKEKKFYDISAVDGNTLYTDSRVKFYSQTPIDYPYTIVSTYEVETGNTGELLPEWLFLTDFKVSTEKSSIAIHYGSPNLKPEVLESNLEDFDITKSEDINSIIYTANNVFAVKPEEGSPSFDKIVPNIKLRPVNFHYEGHDASINSWNDLGLWIHKNLLEGRDELPESTQVLIKNLVGTIEDPLEKARIVHKYVQENTRYISVQVGIGGLQPISALDVDKVKYGDCKGLTNYTKALLKVVGVESYYTHVEAGDEKIDFIDDFPDLAQGNHVILAIPYEEQYIWIDCTSQVHPFGFIGDFTDGRKALLIKPEGGEIVTTTSYTNEENLQTINGQFKLDISGSLTGNIELKTKGIQYDQHFGLERIKKEEVVDYYKSKWGYLNDLSIESNNFENNKKEVEFVEKIGVQIDKYATLAEKNILIIPNVVNRVLRVPKRYAKRKLPFEITRGFLYVDEVVIEIPQGFQIETLPGKIEIENDFGHYLLNVEFENHKIKYKREFSLNARNFPKSSYKDYRDFIRKVKKLDTSKIVLNSK